MTEPCSRTRELLGPYLLGHLGDLERVAFEAHLEGCDACRSERDALAPVAGLLSAVDPEHVGDRPAAPTGLGSRVFERIEEERATRRTRRWRLAGVAAAAAVLVAAIPAVILLSSPDPEVLAFEEAPAGVAATATVEGRPWGTEIRLRVDGLPADEEYAVWLEDEGGERVAAGTFRAIRGREMDLVLASAMPRSGAVGLGVSDDEGETLLYAWMPEASATGSPNA